MPRLRHYLPPLLLLLPVIFICGKLLLTWSVYEPIGGTSSRGWPWIYQLDLTGYFGQKSSDFPFFIWPFIADVALLGFVTSLIGLVFIWQYKRRGSLMRFTLRALLMVVAVVAVFVAWWTSHARQHAREQALIQNWHPLLFAATEYRGPRWLPLLDVTGDFAVVCWHVHSIGIEIGLDHQSSAFELPAAIVAELPYLSNLEGFGISADVPRRDQEIPCPLRLGPTEIAALRRIKRVWLSNDTADDDTLHAVAKLPQLNNLRIIDAPISDEGFAALTTCAHLDTLHLSRCNRLTDKSIDALLKLPELKSLTIDDCDSLTSAGIGRLAQLPNLKVFELNAPPEIAEQVFPLLNGKIPHLFISGFKGN